MKNKINVIVFGCFLGVIIGIIIWTYLFVLNIGTHVLWNYIPAQNDFRFYPLVVCSIGGLLIGLMQKKYGKYPHELKDVLVDYKRNKTTSYDNLHIIAIAAFLPLVFGGSLGPEAGLSEIIVGLCCWFSDRIKYVSQKDIDIRDIGLSATFAVIFGSPLFGLLPSDESENEDPITHKLKVVINLASVLCALSTYMLLRRFVGGGLGISRFSGLTMETREWIALIPLALFGCLLGYVFLSFGKIINKVLKPLQNYVVIRAIIGGLVLGVTGILLSYTMFSGEEQMREIQMNWKTISITLLLLTGFVKILITEFCFNSGWRGGKIFPLIFSATCFGYAIAAMFFINSTFCVAVISSSLLAFVMRKPIVVAMLLLLCFPLEAVLLILFAVFIGTIFPIPKILDPEKA